MRKVISLLIIAAILCVVGCSAANNGSSGSGTQTVDVISPTDTAATDPSGNTVDVTAAQTEKPVITDAPTTPAPATPPPTDPPTEPPTEPPTDPPTELPTPTPKPTAEPLPDGRYSGQMSWADNNYFSSERSHVKLTLNYKKTLKQLSDMGYYGELTVVSKTIFDTNDLMEWRVSVVSYENRNGTLYLHAIDVYSDESLVFAESENNFFIPTHVDLPFASDAEITDYAIDLSYFYGPDYSPNIFSWRDLNAYYNNHSCYDVYVDVEISNGKVASMEFVYIP